jgi:hypothetical protein
MYQLTRYLYELSEVKGNLILALLNKDNNEALFWAFEYYYSGYPCETTNFIIQIYYDFYYVLNPTFEKYMFIQLKKVTLENEYEELALFIKLIIDNLIFRPYTLDTFMLRNMGLQFEVDFDEIEDVNKEIISLLMDHDNYGYMSTLLMQSDKYTDVKELENLYSEVIDTMGSHIKINKNVKMKETNALLGKCYKDDFVLKRTIILAKIINYYSIKESKKMHRSIYLENNIEKQIEELYVYKTKYPTTLKEDANYATNKNDFIGIFQLERFKEENKNYREKYLKNWEYYAYDAPYWGNLFALYEGDKDETQKKVIFEDEENENEFYEDIDYFPDESSKEIQEKSIGKIEKVCNLNEFYGKYGGKNVIKLEEEELADIDLIVV